MRKVSKIFHTNPNKRKGDRNTSAAFLNSQKTQSKTSSKRLVHSYILADGIEHSIGKKLPWISWSTTK